MDELIIDEKKYISSKHAAKITGYAKDYVGQLCREGRIEARLVGRSWYVLESSVREHRYGKETAVSAPDETVSAPEENAQSRETTYTATYIPEEKPYLPELEERTEPESVPEAVKSSKNEVAGISDMQSVWKEWFDTRHLNVSDSADQESEIEIVDQEPESIEQEIDTPVNVYRERGEESTSSGHLEYENEEIEEYTEEEEPVRVANRRIRPPVFAGAVVRAALIALSIVVIAVAALGTGAADQYLETVPGGNNALVGAISGAFYIDK